MSAWPSNFVTANGIRLHYTRTGGDKPPILLAHGFSDDGRCWASIAERLAQTYDVMMIDARGHGLSEAPEQGYGPNEQGDDLAGLIRALALQPPIVLGHSMGAIAALNLASRYPALPRAIALEDPPPRWMNDRDRPYSEQWLIQTRTWITGLQSQTREALIAAQRAQNPRWPEADLPAWADSKLRFRLNFFNQLQLIEITWPALLPAITCPTLLITADPERGSLVTQDQALALQALVPQLRIEHVAGAGHSIRRDQPDRFLEVVNSFFAELAPTL